MDNYIATKKEIGISIPAGNLLSLLHWVKRVFTIVRNTATTPSVKAEKGDMLNVGCDTWKPKVFSNKANSKSFGRYIYIYISKLVE